MELPSQDSPEEDAAPTSTLPLRTEGDLPLPGLGMAPWGWLPTPIAVANGQIGLAFWAPAGRPSAPVTIAPAGSPTDPYQPSPHMKALIDARERATQGYAKKKQRIEEDARASGVVSAQLADATARLSTSEQTVDDAQKSAAEALRDLAAKEVELEQLRQEVDRLRGDMQTMDSTGDNDVVDEVSQMKLLELMRHVKTSKRSEALFLEDRINPAYPAGKMTYVDFYQQYRVLPFLFKIETHINQLVAHHFKLIQKQINALLYEGKSTWKIPSRGKEVGPHTYVVRNLWQEYGLNGVLASQDLDHFTTPSARDRIMRFLAIAETCTTAPIIGVFHGMRLTRECGDVAAEIFEAGYDFAASYRKHKDFPTAFYSLNPLVCCCYPRDTQEKRIMVCLMIELNEPSSYRSACTVQTSAVSPNGDAAILPLAEIAFRADDDVLKAMDLTMEYVASNKEYQRKFPRLKKEIVSKAHIENVPGLYKKYYQDLACMIRGRDSNRKMIPPPIVCSVSGLV